MFSSSAIMDASAGRSGLSWSLGLSALRSRSKLVCEDPGPRKDRAKRPKNDLHNILSQRLPGARQVVTSLQLPFFSLFCPSLCRATVPALLGFPHERREARPQPPATTPRNPRNATCAGKKNEEERKKGRRETETNWSVRSRTQRKEVVCLP